MNMKTTLTNPIVRALLFTTACVLAPGLSTRPAQAGTDFGVRGGTYADVDEPFLGAEALFQVGTTKRWFGNPNLEHAFAHQRDVLQNFLFNDAEDQIMFEQRRIAFDIQILRRLVQLGDG